MQALFESIFDVLYLVGVVAAGVVMIVRGKGNPPLRLFGFMAVVLGVGDSFHLIPRMVALWTTGLAANAAALGIGKLITSITMTVFYLILYYVWRRRYGVRGKMGLTVAMWALMALRVVLCLLPQNQWLSANPPLLWGILRNLPFAAIGVVMIVLFARSAKQYGDKTFRFMALAITLSFALYAPVVLLADKYPLVGMLMIPKTLAYVWVVKMGWNLQKEKTPLRLEQIPKR